ncbi:hypothetical protein [Streptococcus pluranimalium]|uniref:hypothetical protein n=1 Tax=Streptococcus pluranimalium TaxID=82348 RepID=UPI003F672A3F
MIISVQGSMAVGKTSVVNYLEQKLPEVFVSHEDIAPVVTKINQLQLDKDNYKDYQMIQALWIDYEISRYEKVADRKVVLMDFGAEEIDFYTRFYPKACGKDWQLSPQLINKLKALETCLPDLVIYLDASESELRQRKQLDKTRRRSFFDFQLDNLLPIKRYWFLAKDNTIVVDTNAKTLEEVSQEVYMIISKYVSDN